MIITGCVAVALASGHGTPVAGQLTDREACGLEQRMGPWRAACHAPVQFSTAVVASPGTARSRLSGAAALSVFGRSGFPIDRDNGAVWAGKGLSVQLAVGIGGAFGPLRYGVYPTIHWAQNADFAVADFGIADHSPYVYGGVGPWIDWPQRMGASADPEMSPGQSYLEFTGLRQAAVGVSTENIWWGPSKRYPMLLGTTSAGFPHVYARSPTVELGAFRIFGRALLGRLMESEYFDHDSNNDRNLLGTLRLEIGLRSLPGTQLAITSMIRQQWAPDFSLGSLIRKFTPLSSVQSDEVDGAADGLGAITLVLPARSLGIQLHGTWGRGDFFFNVEDLLTEPDHNQFWSIGLHRDWQTAGERSKWGFSVEHASTAATPPQFRVRSPNFSFGIYRHSGTPQGHTHRGQLLGASIGPGARATYVSVDRTIDGRLLGVLLERVLWDIDGYSDDWRSTFPGGQDRETLIAARLGIDLGVSGVARWRLDALGGFSLRRNRQYARFTESLSDYPERETNYWLDLRLAWTPHRASEK